MGATAPSEDPGRPWWASPPSHEGRAAGTDGEDTRGDGPARDPDPDWRSEAVSMIGRLARDYSGHRHHADDASSTDGAATSAPRADRRTRDGEVCAVCPVCTLLRLLDEVRPEVVGHLTEAARHLALAAKAVIDAQAAGFDGDRFERIDLDE